MIEKKQALSVAVVTEEDPLQEYARLERLATRKGYTLSRTPVIGLMLKRGTLSKHFARIEDGFQLLRWA